jgi:hypothetical protein
MIMCVGDDGLTGGEVELNNVSGLQTKIRSPDQPIQNKTVLVMSDTFMN